MTARTHGLTARFVCSYQGESDYSIGGERYSIRSRALADPSCTEEMHREQQQTVGCVYRGHCASDGFPPPEVCALFPGWVPARYDLAARRWVYQGDPPATRTEDDGDVVAPADYPHHLLGY